MTVKRIISAGVLAVAIAVSGPVASQALAQAPIGVGGVAGGGAVVQAECDASPNVYRVSNVAETFTAAEGVSSVTLDPGSSSTVQVGTQVSAQSTVSASATANVDGLFLSASATIGGSISNGIQTSVSQSISVGPVPSRATYQLGFVSYQFTWQHVATDNFCTETVLSQGRAVGVQNSLYFKQIA